MFLTIATDRKEETLETKLKWIYPGSLIINDGWSSYLGIPTISEGYILMELLVTRTLL